MVTTIKLNKRADRTIYAIAEYLELEYSSKAAENFVKNVYDTIEKIQKHPTSGRKSNSSKTVRFVNIDSHRQMFYRVQGKTLFVLDVFDVRQHPDKRPYA